MWRGSITCPRSLRSTVAEPGLEEACPTSKPRLFSHVLALACSLSGKISERLRTEGAREQERPAALINKAC